MNQNKLIDGFSSRYYVTPMGDIITLNWKNTKQEKTMKPAKDAKGYLRTMLLSNGGKYCTIKVHRIIAKAFVENPENKPCVNHKNGIKHDNRIENLEWCTNKENSDHARKMGFQKSRYGLDHHRFRFNQEQVDDIVSKRFAGKMIKDIAKEYRASRCTIRFCLKVYGANNHFANAQTATSEKNT